MKSLFCYLFAWSLFCGAVRPCFGAEIFGNGSSWRFFKGTAAPSAPDATAWRTSGFDDTAWLTGVASFYYGDPFSGTLLDDMYGRYSTVFLRKRFDVFNPAEIQSLTLNAACDDGFICWINGKEVTRFNVGAGEISFDGLATTPVNPDPAVFNDYPITDPRSVLVAGSNLLAIQLLNTSLTSSDIVWDASLSFTGDMEAPVISSVIPPAGSSLKEFFAVEILFSEAVTGVDAGDLLINGVSATNVVQVTPGQFVFSFPKQPTGAVSVAFLENHGIADTAAIPHPFKQSGWSYTVDPTLVVAGLFITEFMAENNGVLRDEDGDKSDWIELFNSSNRTISLLGWGLTDDALDLRKWTFPPTSIAAGARLVVFASGKDRTNAAARLHTNFKLDDRGEFLALVNPAGESESAFSPTFPVQRKNFSYGRATGALNVTGYFPSPTPGTANSTSGIGFAPDVKFSANGGAYLTNFNLSISLKVPLTGAEIRYTTNGTMPLSTSLLYTNSLFISNSIQLRARAFALGVLPGDPHTEFYLKLEGSTPTFNSTLPVLVLHNFGKSTPPATGQQDAYLQVYEPVQGIASFTNAPTLSRRVGIGARGSSTLGLPKVSLNLELRDEFGADDKHTLLGLPEDSDWVLYAPNSFEPVLIHNPFMHQLSRDMGRYSSRTRFVELFLVKDTMAGSLRYPTTYNGIYVLEERVRRSKDRVDIDKLEPENLTAPSVTGGFILKVDRTGPGEGGIYGASQSMVFVEPDETEIEAPVRAPQLQYLRDFFTRYGSALYGANWKDPTNGYRAYFDVEAGIDHHLLNVLSFNVDALRLSTYFYKPRNGKITFGPLWDFDRALGSTDGRDANPKAWTSSGGTDYFNETSQMWWGKMFTDIDFYQQWIDRYQQLRSSHFSTTNLYRLVEELTTEVRKSQPREQTKWAVAPRGGYQGEINLMKTWLSNRVIFMDSQSLVRPTNTTASGKFLNSISVTLKGPTNATIYYTLDGTDPRLAGGNVHPNALIATNIPLVISTNSRLIARLNNNAFKANTGTLNPPLVSKWSGVTEASYYNTTPPLLLTEIMYHPESPSLDSTNSATDFEFLEFKNISSSSLNLVGFKLSGGVQFNFTPSSLVTNLASGARVLIVKNRASFLSRYGTTNLIAGEFTGNLGNGSNRLIINGPLGEPISDVTYESRWLPLSDGFGFSLTLGDESVAQDLIGAEAQWRLSSLPGGSPGNVDLAPKTIPRVWINEVLTHTDPPLLDVVEFLNGEDQTIDITGWWLSDDYRDPKKYKLPQGSVLSANGYSVVDENSFRGGTTGFSFSAIGDSAHLFSADAAGELTGYHHGFSFGAAFNGFSFGRFVSSDGIEHFVTQEKRTLGQLNSAPLVGPLAITEIHFNPLSITTNNNTLDEFIEVRNISTFTVPLWDRLHETNSWHLRGGVDFDFPRSLEIPPGGFVLVVGFNPVVDIGTISSFRAKFQVPVTVPVLGPWNGNLENSGESIELKQPDEPVQSSLLDEQEVPYVSVEKIRYLPVSPWPTTASGTGKSLQRVAIRAFGDDPTNWQSAAPTAGKLNPATDVDDFDRDGLPDAWEDTFGLDTLSNLGDAGATGDPDQDDQSNLEEYIAGTDPKNPASNLSMKAEFGSTGITLTVSGLPSCSYTFWVRESLDVGEWKLLTHFPTLVDSKILPFTVQNEFESRFYRVSVVRD